MRRLEALDLGFAPRPITSAGDFLAHDAERRIVGNAAFFHRPLEHRVQRVEKVALREWRLAFVVDEFLHALALEQHDAIAARRNGVQRLIAVCLSKAF
jgi:hypothetical protein